MTRILCITDNPLHVDMFADMLKRRGHGPVETMVPPLDLARVDAYGPQIVMVNLVRKVATLRSPIANFYAEVDGALPLQALLAHWGAERPPLIVTGLAVDEADLPPELGYDAFVSVPQQLDKLLACIDQVMALPTDIKSSLNSH